MLSFICLDQEKQFSHKKNVHSLQENFPEGFFKPLSNLTQISIKSYFFHKGNCLLSRYDMRKKFLEFKSNNVNNIIEFY